MQQGCATLQAAWRQLVLALAGDLDATVCARAEPMPRELLANLWHVGAKGSRLDEDCKEHVTSTLVKKRKIHSASQALRVLHEHGERVAVDWEANLCLETLEQGKLSLVGSRVVWCVEDSARKCRPAEDMTVYLLWDAAAVLGIYLWPQDFGQCLNRVARKPS